MPRPTVVAVLVLAILLTTPRLPAACVALAGRCEGAEFEPGGGGRCAVDLRFATMRAEVSAGVVRVQCTVSLAIAPGATGNLVCLVTLPAGAEAAQAALAGLPGSRAEFLAATAADAVRASAARVLRDPSLLAGSGRPALLFRTLAASSSSRPLELAFGWRQPVRRGGGLCELAVPLPSARTALVASVAEDLPLRSVFSPSHAVRIERPAAERAQVSLARDDGSAGDEFRLVWVADRDPLGLRVLACREPGEEEGRFLLVGEASEGDGPPPPLDLALAIDASGSMRGEKAEQARAAARACLAGLRPCDRFNLVAFGDAARAFRPAPVPADPANLAAAGTFLEGIVPDGRTNLDAALASILSGTAEAGRQRAAILITDGAPTAGELRPQAILANAAAAGRGIRIFPIGIGTEVNVHLLDRLAAASDGASLYLAPDDAIDAAVAALAARIGSPVLENVEVAVEGVRMGSLRPRTVPSIWRGAPFILAGRYGGGGPATVTVSGTRCGLPVAYRCRAEFPAAAGGEPWVATAWAARSIGFLLQEIRIGGGSREQVEEVARLSRRYGIVTEYTDFIATADARYETAQSATDEARRRMQAANAVTTGAWAVAQALRERELQQGRIEAPAVASPAGAAATILRRVGARAFYLRDGHWTDAEEQAARPLRSVRLLSDEHLRLLREHAGLAEAQELGGNLELNLGAERIRFIE